MPSFFIRLRSVLGLTPRSAAAPSEPFIFPQKQHRAIKRGYLMDHLGSFPETKTGSYNFVTRQSPQFSMKIAIVIGQQVVQLNDLPVL